MHIYVMKNRAVIPAITTAVGTATAAATTVTDVESTTSVGPGRIVDGIGDTVAVT